MKRDFSLHSASTKGHPHGAEKRNPRHDAGLASETDSDILPAAAGRFPVPAAVQLYGYHGRRRRAGHGGAGGGGRYRIAELPHQRLLHGHLLRLRDSDCAGVRREGRDGNAPLCDALRVPVRGDFRADGAADRLLRAAAPADAEHAGGYSAVVGRIYPAGFLCTTCAAA